MECLSGGVTSMMLNGGRCPSHQMCVDACPTEFWLYEIDAEIAMSEIAKQDDTLQKGAQNGLAASGFFDKFYCTPQAQRTINKIKTGDILLKDAMEEIETYMQNGDCSSKQMPSSPYQNRCFPGQPKDVDLTEGKTFLG